MRPIVHRLATLATPVRAALGPYAVLLAALAIGLAALAFARAGLALLLHDRIAGTPELWRMFTLGLRMDALLLCYLLLVPAAVLAAAPAQRARDLAVAGWLAVCATAIALLEAASPDFVLEYDKRPDRVFIEYLGYPKELLATMWADRKLALFAVPTVAATAGVLAWRGALRSLAAAPAWGWRRRLALFPLVFLALALGARSSFEPHPANISTASFSANRLVNELTLSSAYTLAYSVYSMRGEASAAAIYGRMPWHEVATRVRRYEALPDTAFVPAEEPLLHRTGAAAARHRNLVIIVEESLGAGFSGHLGGLPLTPNLDRLSAEGMDFQRLYATGTRTARGLEAIVAGFPPSPALSALKLPGAQGTFFTLASALRAQGYRTSFIYGGAANFDNMRSFFLKDGFDRVIEEADFVDPEFVASWGVSDEDLFRRANEEFRAAGAGPFFAVVLTSSDHEPFEIPAGRIEPYNQPLFTRENAVKYADHALGRFFEAARREDYWDDTVFLVVADHDARVFGAPLIPLDHFRIPAVILGPGVPVQRYAKVASQIDLGPTLLHLVGVEAQTPMPGRDLIALPAATPGRALMQYGLNHGLLVDDRLVVHLPGGATATFAVAGDELTPIADDPELTRDGLAHALWAEETYRRKLYRVPP